MPSASYPAARRAGFSLVELVVFLTIVGVTLGVLIPRIRPSARSKVDQAALQLVNDLDVSRTRALATRSLVWVTFSQSPDSYLGYLDSNRDGTIAKTAAEAEALRGSGARTLPDGVTFGRGSAPALTPGDPVIPALKRVEFTSRGFGTVAGASANIYLQSDTDGGAVSAVMVLPSGAVRVRRYVNGAWQ